MFEKTERIFRELVPAVDFCSLRAVDTRSETLQVQRDVALPPVSQRSRGAMVTVIEGKGLGYAATHDLSRSGLTNAVERARSWAKATGAGSLFDYRRVAYPHPVGEFFTEEEEPWASVSEAEKFGLLTAACRELTGDERLVDQYTLFQHTTNDSLYLTSDGGRVAQRSVLTAPGIWVAAHAHGDTVTRSAGFGSLCQGGMEVLRRLRFESSPREMREEVLALVEAPDCPSGTMSLLIAPDQAYLQVHESIGHPLELDRVLGDERNYAGTTFVTPEMVGSYRYGTDLLNITFDPGVVGEAASYGYDDEGMRAERQHIIENGVLMRLLGGVTSQARSGLPGVASCRASSWARPPIDRMANLNLEPGDSTLEEMIGAVERGIYMRSNCSWSIDDSRRKFQFGCEWGQLIEKGRLTQVVKKPNYRGISATFWRHLEMVGRADTVEMLGTPYCGKGEPNQAIHVGHSTPPCLFSDVDVFGGA